ncbi:hypothetical protein ABVT39_022780 [Epinephelus coioides]
MAAARYFPSIHDKTAENKKTWALFDPKPTQLNFLTSSSSTDSFNKDCKAGANHNSSTSQQVEAKAAWTASGCLAVPDYQPLEVFSMTAEVPGSASWSEEDELCELNIRLKEIELRNMIGDTPGIPQCK